MKTNRPNHNHFASYNIETGETQEGYMEKGQMKFRRLPWWKQIFQKRIKTEEPKIDIETKFDGTATVTETYRTGKVLEYKVSIYKRIRKDTGKVIEVYTVGGGYGYHHNLDIEAWENGKILVFI